MYTTFYAAPCPIILCEGQTDNIYLTHAIRSLASEYPSLASIGGDQKIALKVRLYKYPRSSTARILGLNDGGSSILAAFIGRYEQRIAKFTAAGLQHAVIVLYDKDDGAKAIRGAIKSAKKTAKIENDAPYIHVHKNLYAVPISLADGRTEASIEDCFDEAIKTTVLAGKTFDKNNVFDTATSYGKNVFAHKVIRPRADKIDFTGFRATLDSLVAVIDAHRQSMISD